MANWRRLVLEISLKPFYDSSYAATKRIAEGIFQQWAPLIETVDEVSLMFWAADGSELLDYQGNLDGEFEWGKWIGAANPLGKISPLPPEEQPPWVRPRLYRENPRSFTYRQFKEIIDVLRQVFAEKYHRKLLIGTTFDPGPEFAVSAFKYQRHRESCRGFNCFGGKSFVCCYSHLNGDGRNYAAFPDGIPDGTSIGTFLGRQAQRYLDEMGFDYIWFSNGFGFGMESWGACGAVFDGLEFSPEKSAGIREVILAFWKDFRAACPDYPVETRGTNHSTGTDISADATPLREIYRSVKAFTGPPNSPSASLDGNYAMEITGYLSHIAELPLNQNYPFRYYLHDPWFMFTPWLHCYGRNAHDIYLPLSLTRLDASGKTGHADTLHILSINDSHGEFPPAPAQEVIAELLHSATKRPDVPGPIVWVYPFDEYHDLGFAGERIKEIFAGDYLVRGGIDHGFPLSTVISGGNFLAAVAAKTSFRNRILLVPTIFTVNQAMMTALEQYLNDGGQVIFYGPAHGEAIERLLGLTSAPGIAGDFEMAGGLPPDEPRQARHLAFYSGGELDRINADEISNQILLEYVRGNERRPALLMRKPAKWHGGCAVWIRGTNSFYMEKHCYAPTFFDAKTNFHTEKLFRLALTELGWRIEFEKEFFDQSTPILTLRYWNNAIYLAIFGRDVTLRQRFQFPDGAPIFVGSDAILTDNLARYNVERSGDLECRVFVTGGNGIVTCREAGPGLPNVRRRLIVNNLKNARLVFRPEPDNVENVRFFNENGAGYPLSRPSDFPAELRQDAIGFKYVLENVKGQVIINW